MGKQVQQSTFDAIVREAMEDFGLTPDEAIAEAREQLKKAGVTDFSNISTTPSSLSDDQHPGIFLPRQLEDAFNSFDITRLTDLLIQLSSQAKANSEIAGVAGSNNAVSLLLQILQKVVKLLQQDQSYEQLARLACETVIALCSSDEINRSKFVTDSRCDGIGSLIDLLALLNENTWNQDKPRNSSFDVSTFVSIASAIASIQRQNEKVKRRIAAGDSLDHLLSIMDRSGDHILCSKLTPHQEAFVSLFTKLCVIIRQMLTADDSTTLVPETFNRARVITGSKAATESGLRPLSVPNSILQILHKVSVRTRSSPDLPAATKRRLLTDCIHTARLAAVSDEICADLMELQFHEVALAALKEHIDSVPLVQACMALLRNLSGRDQCKTPIFENIASVRQAAERYIRTSSRVAEQYCGLLSSLCLRRSDISTNIVETGMVDTILEAMGAHSDNSGIQRVGCLCIRNMCSRDEEVRRKLRQGAKAETVIRNARKLFPVECGEAAYSALRDMDVLVDEELRCDERYKMPACFYKTKIVRPTS